MAADTGIRSRPGRQVVETLLGAAGLPSADLTDAHLEHFFYAGRPESPVGLVGLELHGDIALLRSLAVAPGARAVGLGSALVAHAEAHARARAVRGLYLLTTTAEEFFAKRGYARIGRERAPAAIRATREFGELCPSSSAFMFKNLE